MSSPSPHDPKKMHALCQLALDAGACIAAHHHKGVEKEIKSDKSIVTIADREAEDILTKGLAHIFPQIQVIGEEACAEDMPSHIRSQFFLLDPLDGTYEFVNGGKDFTVNIGLINNHYPVAGVIYAPLLEALYISGDECAYKAEIAPDGDLAKVDFHPLRTDAFNTQKGVRVIASKSHRNERTEAMIEKLNVAELVATGSSLKFCVIAEGKADFYPRYGRTMEWDTAAGQAILEAAGGQVCFTDGRRLSYGKHERGLDNPDFIASGQENWPAFLKK